jgi:hypothetical protein
MITNERKSTSIVRVDLQPEEEVSMIQRIVGSTRLHGVISHKTNLYSEVI